MLRASLISSLVLLPVFAQAQSLSPNAVTPADNKAPVESKLKTNISGFIAIDLFNMVKVEEREKVANMGIGTVNLDAHARYDNTRLKIKLDIDDGKIGIPFNIFEEAYVVQEFTPEFSIMTGKGVVPFHQKHYGVITDSYVDGGSRIGSYYWNYGDQDNRLLLSAQCGSKNAGFKNSLTFFGATEGQLKRSSKGDALTISTDSALGTVDPVTKATKQVKVPATWDTIKGFNPSDQRGLADKVEVYWTKEFSTAVAGLTYWNRLDPHLSRALATSGRYVEDKVLEVWYEAQYGFSSSYMYSFKDKKEVLAQLGAEYYLSDLVSVLTNAETATFSYTEFQNKKGSRTTDIPHAKLVETKGTLSKIEAGAAVHFNDRATLTTGGLYEIGDVKIGDVTKTTDRNGMQFVSSFTFAF